MSATRFIFGSIIAFVLLMLPLVVAFTRLRRVRARWHNRVSAAYETQKFRTQGNLYCGGAVFSAVVLGLLAAYSDDGALLAIGLCFILTIVLSGAVLGPLMPYRGEQVRAERRSTTEQHEWARRGEFERDRVQAQQLYPTGEREWWDVLGVSRNAPLSEIKRIYRARIKECHPDRVTGLSDEIVVLAERRTKELNAAFAQAKARPSSPAQSPLHGRVPK